MFSIQALSLLIKLHHLPREQRVLQRPTDGNALDAQLQLNRDGLVIQNAGHELVRLGGKRILEALPVLLGHRVADTVRVRHLDMVGARDQVHHDLALGARDLRADVVAMSLGPRAVEVGDLAAPVLDDADAIVDVLQGSQLGVVLERADGVGRLRHEVLAHVEEREVDVVNAAVDEDAAVAGGVAHEEARVIEQIAGLGAHDERRPDALKLLLRGAVRGVEAAGVARHDFQFGVGIGNVDDMLGLFVFQADGALARESRMSGRGGSSGYVPLLDRC